MSKKPAQIDLTPVQVSDYRWEIDRQGPMHAPVVIFGGRGLVDAMDRRALEQAANVACLPGIVQASYVMPDAHQGYGFPIGGVAAFDPDQGGVISAGGVGFDIACGVRTLRTGLAAEDVLAVQEELADALFARVPAGLGKTGDLQLKGAEMDAMLEGGAKWAVSEGYGAATDLEFTEEGGCMQGAVPEYVSAEAKKRQEREVGTLGSGNHYLEVQQVARIYDAKAADAFGLREGDAVVSIHCGSRGLGHQIGTDFLKRMAQEAARHKITLPDRELACAPVKSRLGQQYLGAMYAGINCALANRQVITHLVREAFADILPMARLGLVYDVAHNTCKQEQHETGGSARRLYVHRKGATRAFGPGHPDVPARYRAVGQPVLVGGSMGTASFILAGNCGPPGAGATAGNDAGSLAFCSANHGAGRAMSRSQAKKQFTGRDVSQALRDQGVFIRAQNFRGVAEEAPGAYKDVDEVVQAAEQAGLARPVAQLMPMVCVKG